MRICLPIGIICFFGFFVIFVVIQSLIVITDTGEEIFPLNGSIPGPGVITQCLELAKSMPLPILRCSHEECVGLHGLFQCQTISLENRLIPSSEEILCRNLTSVLLCDLQGDLNIENNFGKQNQMNNYEQESRILNCVNIEENEIYTTSYSKSNMCFSSRGLYYCVHNKMCQRIPDPTAVCTCQLVPQHSQY